LEKRIVGGALVARGSAARYRWEFFSNCAFQATTVDIAKPFDRRLIQALGDDREAVIFN